MVAFTHTCLDGGIGEKGKFTYATYERDLEILK